MFNWLTDPAVVGGIGTAVTAVATIALFVVTAVLAKETRRLATLSSQPQVVATIQRNRWGFGFADLHVENTGNASAFDIRVQFSPPLETEPVDEGDPPPLQSISVLKPGQALSSYLTEYLKIIDTVYTVTVSWKRSPSDNFREELVYTIRIADIRGSSQLGSDDPVVQIADDIRKLREDFHHLATGWKKPRVDVFTSADRQAEREKALQQREERRAARSAEQPEPEQPEAAPRRGWFAGLMALFQRGR